MEQDKIIEGNKLICDFMGNEKITGRIADEQRQYHSSWDWIMPVVIKIRDLAIPEYTKKKDVQHFLVVADIENLHFAVVQFIKWYNTSNPSQTTPAKGE